MAISVHDQQALLTLAFSVHSNPGAYAVLLGAGVSAPSGVPTAWDVIVDLTGQVAELAGATPDKPVHWYESEFGEVARYETLLERLAPTPLERQRLLRQYFEPTPEEAAAGKKGPTAAHRAIARLIARGSVRVVVTLNFDRLLEQAIRAEGIEPTVVSSVADFAGLAPLHTLDCCIIHLHGDYLNPVSMRNTTDELASYEPETLRLVERVMEDYGLVIAGWSSASDPALREVIAASYPRRLTMTWVEPYRETVHAVELRTKKQGQLLVTDADQAFGTLADAVDAIAARRSRHPLSAAVAIETAKRELSGKSVAISIHDTLGAEFALLHESPELNLSDTHDTAQRGGLSSMRAAVLEAAKIPVALVATLAFWGGATTDTWWIDEVSRLAVRRGDSGAVDLLDLGLVPASALLYAAGVAAVAGRRYDLVAALLRLERDSTYRDGQELLGAVLAADSVLGGGSESSRAMLEHLLPVLQEALGSGRHVVEEAWEQFEVLRLTAALMKSPQFTTDAHAVANAYPTWVESVRVARQSGRTDDERLQTEASAELTRGLRILATRVPVFRPHVRTRMLDLRERMVAPVAEQLAREVDAQGGHHPLIRAGFDTTQETLAAALRAVSFALGQEARTTGRQFDPDGTVRQRTWLDEA